MKPLYLPDLEERALTRFDELAKMEKIFYEEATSQLITVNGFDVSRTFVFSTSLYRNPLVGLPSPYTQRKNWQIPRTVTRHIADHQYLVSIHRRQYTEEETNPSCQCA